MLRIVDMTLIRPLNKGQGHLFWYQSIFHMRLPIKADKAVNSNFCYRTHRLATIHSVQTYRRNTVTIERPLVRSLVRSAKNRFRAYLRERALLRPRYTQSRQMKCCILFVRLYLSRAYDLPITDFSIGNWNAVETSNLLDT